MNYENFEEIIIRFLNKANSAVLATSDSKGAHARTMSIVNKGLDIYFQSNMISEKHEQILENNNVALCINGVTFEGEVFIVGNWEDTDLKEMKEIYKAKHQERYDNFGSAPGVKVYKFNVRKIKTWRNIEGVSYTEMALPEIKYYKRSKVDL